MDYQAAFYELFTDDPVNWVKWGIVFVVLILGYRFSIPLLKKVSYRLGLEYKRDLARERGHVIKAFIQHQYSTGDPGSYNWHARYRYSIDGKERTYRAFFKHPSQPPRVLYLYYVNNPRRLFSMEEYHGGVLYGIVMLFVIFLPWILACIAIGLLGIPLPQ